MVVNPGAVLRTVIVGEEFLGDGPCMSPPTQRAILIGDSYVRTLKGMDSTLWVTNCGKNNPIQVADLLRTGRIKIKPDKVILVLGNVQVSTWSPEQIVNGIKQVVLVIRNRYPDVWCLVSTVWTRPKDENKACSKLLIINEQLHEAIEELAKVGCRVLLINAHRVLLDANDKLLRPIQVYFDEGSFPSKAAAKLLLKYFNDCLDVFDL